MSYISRIHDDLRLARVTTRNATIGADTPRGLHKTYARMPRIILPQPENITKTLVEVLAHRTSSPTALGGSLSLDTYGTLLGLSLGKSDSELRRPYPSGGSLYPIETYVLTDSIEGRKATALHYNPTEHALEILWALPEGISVSNLFKNSEETPASTLIIFTAVWERSSAKYGDFSYILSLLEAGHLSQNILLSATALGIPACPLSGFDDQAIIKLLDLRPGEEQPIHVIGL